MQIRIPFDQLRAALDQMELARKAGFVESLAVFTTTPADGFLMADGQFSDVWARASATDGHQDWGRHKGTPIYAEYHVDSGRLVPNQP